MATTTTETAATRAPTEVVRELFEQVLNRRDADAMRAYMADDVVEIFPEGPVRGPDALRNHFAMIFAAMPDFHIEPETILGDQETVFVRWRLTGTFSGAPYMGIQPTGACLELQGMDCFTIRDGRVAHNVVLFDQLEFARQIGMMPRQDSGGDRMLRRVFNAQTKLRKLLGRSRRAQGSS